VKAGKLNTPISIERLEARKVPGKASDAEEWVAVHQLVWAAVENKTILTEQYTPAGAAPVAQVGFRVRGPLDPIDTTMRVRRSQRVFDIVGIQNVGEQDAELVLICKEGQREGSSHA
jgi:head-tail adaptor